MGLTVVDRAVCDVRLVAQDFHDVDLTALRPLTVVRLVLRHHPERRPETLSFGDLGGDDYLTVHEVGLVLTLDLAGSIVIVAVLVGRLDGLDVQAAVLDVDVLLGIRVFLQFVVGPPRITELFVPLGLIELVSVELVAPEKVITIDLGSLGLRRGTAGQTTCRHGQDKRAGK